MNRMSLLAIVSAIWVLSELGVLILKRSSGAASERRDRGSLLVIWSTITIATFAGSMLARQRVGRIGVPAVFWIGLGTIVAGVVVRWTAILTLRRFFTVSVTIREGHQLIRSGIYSVVRHPAYTGSILSFFGLGLAFGNWFSFAAVAIATIAGFSYRIRVEERALTEHFGDAYREYAAETKRLIPGVY
jgi:protein-S-isoprenylcysteine O-methyltransferase Ste14